MTLRTGSVDDIHLMFRQLNGEKEALIASLVELVYFMRGSIQYRDMLDMTLIERQQVNKFVAGRLEAEAGKPYPNY